MERKEKAMEPRRKGETLHLKRATWLSVWLDVLFNSIRFKLTQRLRGPSHAPSSPTTGFPPRTPRPRSRGRGGSDAWKSSYSIQ